jgi:hypothetical protein
MYYVVQENLFREYGFKALTNHLDRLKISQVEAGRVGYEIVKYIPFSGTLEVKSLRKDVFFFGYSGAGKIGMEKYGWKPGVFFNENFDMRKYLVEYGSHMLNHDGYVWETERSLNDDKFYFIRPLGDGKEFTGQIFGGSSWNQYTKDNIDLKEKCPLVLVASPKTTQQEIRCWMVDSEPVTISQYKIGSRANYLNMDHNEEAVIFARKMAKIFQPDRAYCLDICLYDNEYYIVELGCINHCGFYDANMGKLIDALEQMKL